MNVFVFDIETIPDVAAGRRLLGLSDLDDNEVAEAMFAMRRQENGTDFLRHALHRIACISVVFCHGEHFNVWSLGEEDASEKAIIERFYKGLEKYTPTIVSWNGSGFDLPVLHYRALYHGVSAPRYWDQGEHDNNFRFNNYLNRFHARHLDLMDVLSGYQSRATMPLDSIASFLGYPGKMGQSGANVWQQYQAGELSAIRNYCETDVLNTFLVYLSFQRMRGQLEAIDYEQACDRLKTFLHEQDKAHFSQFLDVWQQSTQDKM